jgi:hypothetical protein
MRSGSVFKFRALIVGGTEIISVRWSKLIRPQRMKKSNKRKTQSMRGTRSKLSSAELIVVAMIVLLAGGTIEMVGSSI